MKTQFYKNHHWKNANTYRIPQGWDILNFTQIFRTITPPAKIKKSRFLEEGKFPIIDQSVSKIAGYINDNITVIKDVPVLIFGDHTCIVKYINFPFACGADGTKILQTNNNLYNLKFLYYFLQHWPIKQEGYKRHFSKLKDKIFVIPPIHEQKAITRVLSQMDDAIEKVEESIKKWKRIKKAAMRKLFSEGIGHKKFKYVGEVGRVPKRWEVKLLYQIAKIIMGQSPPSSSYNDENGVPFLQGNAEFGKKFPNHLKYTTNPTKIAPINSILISVRAPVGDINIANREYCIGRGLASIIPTKINDNYLFYLLSHLKYYIQTRSSGSTFKAISKDDIKNLHILLPPLPEQKRIAGILEKIDRVIDLKEEKKKHLEKAKIGVMKLLLTGQVRIRVQ